MGLIDEIRRDIAGKVIVDHGRLPTLRQLALRYGCGSTSVKRAFDQLEMDGVLRVVRGRGNFVVGETSPYGQKKSRIIGAILLEGGFMPELNLLKGEYLDAGWLFSIYDATIDRQSPVKEKKFLESARRQNFCAFIINATPIEPVNRDLFMRLRSDGCKVVHLTPYVEDMSEECYFMTDYYHAASLAVLRIAAAGYKRVFFVGRERTGPHVSLIEKGVNDTIRDGGLELLGSVTVHHKETEALMNSLPRLPEGTAILCFDTELGAIVQWCCSRMGYAVKGHFGLVSLLNTFGVIPNHSHLLDDAHERARDVMEYVIDERRSPFEKVQKLYHMSFCDLGTL